MSVLSHGDAMDRVWAITRVSRTHWLDRASYECKGELLAASSLSLLITYVMFVRVACGPSVLAAYSCTEAVGCAEQIYFLAVQ